MIGIYGDKSLLSCEVVVWYDCGTLWGLNAIRRVAARHRVGEWCGGIGDLYGAWMGLALDFLLGVDEGHFPKRIFIFIFRDRELVRSRCL